METFIEKLNEKISADPIRFKIKNLQDFPYTDFETLKNDIFSNVTNIISPYNPKILKLLPKSTYEVQKENILLTLPVIILIISIILIFLLNEWMFLLILLFHIYIGVITSKFIIKNLLLLFILFILPIIALFYLMPFNNWVILSILYSVNFIIISMVRIHYLNKIKTFCLTSEEYFCYFLINNLIIMNIKGKEYNYKAVIMAKTFIETLEKSGII